MAFHVPDLPHLPWASIGTITPEHLKHDRPSGTAIRSKLSTYIPRYMPLVQEASLLLDIQSPY